MSEKNKKKITISLIVVIAVALIWFLIISPLIQFKKSEKEVLNAGKRYFEVNKTYLPTGNRIKTISLKTLYNKDFIKDDIKVPNSSSMCDENESWVKVQKKNNEYNYNVYLKCGIYSSKVDHKGPTITLKGENEITVNKGDKFKDPGIVSVSDNTDGKIDTKQVKVDSNVNINKNGTYEIKYSVKDSFDNKTEVIRTVKVVQILDKIVKKETDKTNYYKGNDNNNYIKLDGILFKIVGLNEDGSVKVTSSEPLAFVDYNSVDTWLNDYFYDKLSDNVKKYIKNDSKWCNEEISNTDNYTKCNKYGKKKAMGLLSVADINNSKDKEGNFNILSATESWTSNLAPSKKAVTYYTSNGYSQVKQNKNLGIYPTININKNSYIAKGSGTIDNPYILKGNSSSLKVGNNISKAKSGEYITYSGYSWRIIDKENDGTAKAIMDETISINGESYDISFSNQSKISYNVNEKDNMGSLLNNNITSYVKTGLFSRKKLNSLNYKKSISYSSEIKGSSYSSKLHLPSMYDLFGASIAASYWYGNYSSDSNIGCVMTYDYKLYCGKYNPDSKSGVRLVGYFDKKTVVKGGKGTIDNPYTLTK